LGRGGGSWGGRARYLDLNTNRGKAEKDLSKKRSEHGDWIGRLEIGEGGFIKGSPDSVMGKQ